MWQHIPLYIYFCIKFLYPEVLWKQGDFIFFSLLSLSIFHCLFNHLSFFTYHFSFISDFSFFICHFSFFVSHFSFFFVVFHLNFFVALHL